MSLNKDNITEIKGSLEFGHEKALKYYFKIIENPERELDEDEKIKVAEYIAEAVYEEL